MVAAESLSTFLAIKGVLTVVCGIILFVGSIYMLLGAVFGLRMGYLVLAVSFFGWMIILSALWTFGATFLGVGTLRNLGPRATEAHWQVFAAGSGDVRSKYEATAIFPGGPWKEPDSVTTSSLPSVQTAIQEYLAEQAQERIAEEEGRQVVLDPTTFSVEDVEFASIDGTSLAGAHAFFGAGGPQVAVFVYRDHGNVPVYSVSILAGSVVGFLVHLPFLDRAEKKRKAILTGGTAPPWYGPA